MNTDVHRPYISTGTVAQVNSACLHHAVSNLNERTSPPTIDQFIMLQVFDHPIPRANLSFLQGGEYKTTISWIKIQGHAQGQCLLTLNELDNGHRRSLHDWFDPASTSGWIALGQNVFSAWVGTLGTCLSAHKFICSQRIQRQAALGER